MEKPKLIREYRIVSGRSSVVSRQPSTVSELIFWKSLGHDFEMIDIPRSTEIVIQMEGILFWNILIDMKSFVILIDSIMRMI